MYTYHYSIDFFFLIVIREYTIYTQRHIKNMHFTKFKNMNWVRGETVQ